MKLIHAKFNSKCAETGRIIKQGDVILYDYSTKKCYCEHSQTFVDYNKEDSAAGMIQANEDAYFDNFCYNNNI